ncbi:MAG: biotin--[acetyl-CoA-carboxylase] ligase [Pseudomonadota bacterium]|nr:biotin--[acetyl-CoA-carboxylase] ligase [Pseudomonadota bacterium]
MRPPTLAWPADALRTQLAPLLPGVVVEVVAEIDSTNSELMRRARAGHAVPTLLVAELQNAGRGRLGRGWQAGDGAPGGALAFSLGLPLAPRDWSGLSLAVGLAVAESLHPDIRLKWPNDLWWRGRKLAGILVETAGTGQPGVGRYAVIGIGVNIAPLEGEGFSTPPAWLRALLPGIEAPAALARITTPLVQTVRAFEQGGFAPLVPRFAARDLLAGQAVRLSDGTEGQAQGVGPGGELRVHTPAGLREVHSAEVSVRPRAPEGEG